MKIAVGNDNRGYQAKLAVVDYLKSKNYDVIDCGTFDEERCDYPDFGVEVGRKVASGEAQYGVVICSSGEGISITANKIKGIRCGIGYNDDVTRLMRQHNDANVISFGATFMSNEEILKRVEIFLSTDFEGGRHERRVNKIKDLEK